MTTTDLTAEASPGISSRSCPRRATRVSTRCSTRRRDRRRARGRARDASPRSTPTGSPTFMTRLAELHDIIGRAGCYAGPRLRGRHHRSRARRAHAAGRGARHRDRHQLLFFELEWAELADDRVDALLADDRLAFAAHYLRSARRYRPHLLTEPEEVVLTEKDVTGRSAWERLFDELTSTITVELDGETTPLEAGLSRLHAPDREVRQAAAEAVTEGLAARAAHARVRVQHAARRQVDRRPAAPLRVWIASRNLANEASDESVQALVDAVQGRYDIPQRWYTLKAQLLGLDRLADYDRMASVADVEAEFGWDEASDLVLDAYASFSPELADVARDFFDDAGSTRPRVRASGRARSARTPCRRTTRTCCSTGRRAGATCSRSRTSSATACTRTSRAARASSTRPRRSRSPRPRRCSARRSRSAGCSTRSTDPAGAARAARREPRGSDRDGVPPDRDEPLRGRGAHRAPRGGRAVGRPLRRALGEHADRDARRLGRDHRGLPHVVVVHPALHRHARLRVRVRVRPAARAVGVRAVRGAGAPTSCRSYLELLRAGGSMSPEELGAIVGVDLADPGFWDGGLDIVERQLEATERPRDAATALPRESRMTYRVIQWSTGNVGRHALRLHRAPSRARARRPVGALAPTRRARTRGSCAGIDHRRARDQRRRRVARARRRLRRLHRDRRPASGAKRSTTWRASSRRARTSCRARSCRSCSPRTSTRRCARPLEEACAAGGRVVLHVGHRSRLGERPAAARAHRHVRVRRRAARDGDRQLRDVRAADRAVRHDGLRPAARRDAVAAASRACCRSRGAAS